MDTVPNSFQFDDVLFESDFHFAIPLDFDPHLPEVSENLIRSTFYPSILGNTPGTDLEDAQLQQPLVGTRSPPHALSPLQEYFTEAPLENLVPQTQTRSLLGTDPRHSRIQGVPPRQISLVQSSSFSGPSFSTSSSNPSASNSEAENNLPAVFVAASSDSFPQAGSQNNGRCIGDRRHLCPWHGCQRAFSLRKDLSRHQTTHTRARTHQCPNPGCNKCFTRADNCLRHSKTDCRRRPGAQQQ